MFNISYSVKCLEHKDPFLKAQQECRKQIFSFPVLFAMDFDKDTNVEVCIDTGNELESRNVGNKFTFPVLFPMDFDMDTKKWQHFTVSDSFTSSRN